MFLPVFLLFLLQSPARSSENAVVSATNETFPQLLTDNPHVLALFFREDRTGFHYLSLLQNISTEFPAVTFAAIDLKSSISLRTSHNLTHFPLLKLYIREKNLSETYQGGKSIDNLRRWLSRCLRNSPHPVKEVTSFHELQRFLTNFSTVQAYFGPKSSKNHEIFHELAEKSPLFTYVTAFSVEIVDQWLSEEFSDGRFVCFNGAEASNYTYPSEKPVNLRDLRAFFSGCARKSYFSPSFEEAEALFKGSESFMGLAVNSSVEESQRALGVFVEMKPWVSERFTLAVFDCQNKDPRVFGFVENSFEISVEDVSFLPQLVFVDREARVPKKYKYFGGIYNNSLEDFFGRVKNRTIEEFYKNVEETLLDQDEGAVQCLNSEKLREIVLKDAKINDFLVVYTKSCAPCRKFKEIFAKIAEKYKEIREKLRFFMIDGANNDLPGVEIVYAPTFLLYKAGDKENPLRFEEYMQGEERFHEFLQENLPFFAEKAEL